MLIATAAILPLVVYGVVSVRQLKSATERSVTEGNTQVATQAAEQIQQYIDNNQRVLRALGAELRAPNSRTGSARASSATSCSTFPSSARSRCSITAAR